EYVAFDGPRICGWWAGSSPTWTPWPGSRPGPMRSPRTRTPRPGVSGTRSDWRGRNRGTAVPRVWHRNGSCRSYHSVVEIDHDVESPAGAECGPVRPGAVAEIRLVSGIRVNR